MKRLVGTSGNFGEQIGLTMPGLDVIRAVGNYSEVFERNLGSKPRLPSRAGSINYGTPAAFNTRRRSGDAADGPSTIRRDCVGGCALAALAVRFIEAAGIGISLLPIDAPIAQLIDRDRLAGNGAAHIRARTDDAKIAVKNFNFRLASSMGRAQICSCQSSRFDCSMPRSAR